MARRSTALRHDRALCLRRFRYGESSLLIHALTPRHGRVALLAKGAYRLRSGYFGVLDLFDTLELEWSRSGSELGLVRRASIARRRKGVTGDLQRYRAALSGLELCNLVAREEHPEPELFGAVETALDLWSTNEVRPQLVLLVLDLAWLRLAGLAPAFDRCASCGRAAPGPRERSASDEARFSSGAGGLLCTACATAARGAAGRIVRLPWNVLRTAQSLSATPIAGLRRVELAPSLETPLRELVLGFLEYHLERRLRSRTGVGPGVSRLRRSHSKLAR